MDPFEQNKEPLTSLEECKRILSTLPVEYARILQEFINKIDHELQELERRKQ